MNPAYRFALRCGRCTRLTGSIIGPSDECLKRLENKLKEGGINFNKKENLEPPLADDGEVELKIDYMADNIIFRGAAKIAFNYVAYVMKPRFVLRPEFDEFRNYVRYGIKPQLQLVSMDNRPILADDTLWRRQTNGHLITFDWNSIRDGFVVQLSLFNSITYRFRLCERYLGLWFPAKSGHHFDVDSKTISKLGSTTKPRTSIRRSLIRSSALKKGRG
jgi:hypothetical protein